MSETGFDFLRDVSIIIPVGKKDESWRDLIKELRPLKDRAEIIFALSGNEIDLPEDWKRDARVKIGNFNPSRAVQLNGGANMATGKILWFLHADTRFTKTTLTGLKQICPGLLETVNPAIYYFDLYFWGDGPDYMMVNALGVWIRSHALKLPFGDQGFLVHKNIFEKLGGFPEREIGEDHDFIWKARLSGLKIQPAGASLYTSARKYLQNGWARTTASHLGQTFKSAAPQFFRLLTQKKTITEKR